MVIIYLGGRYRDLGAMWLVRPGRPPRERGCERSCFRWGLPAAASPRTAVSSYLTISPLGVVTSKLAANTTLEGLSLPGGLFLWHFPSSHPDRTLSCTLPDEARTFLEATLACDDPAYSAGRIVPQGRPRSAEIRSDGTMSFVRVAMSSMKNQRLPQKLRTRSRPAEHDPMYGAGAPTQARQAASSARQAERE